MPQEYYDGALNPNNWSFPTKMTIQNEDTDKKFEVLYNPQSYAYQRSVNYGSIPMMGTNAPVLQFSSGSGDTVSFELFFDSTSAGSEVGGDSSVIKLFTDNKPKIEDDKKDVDVRKYTDQVYNLMLVEPSVHRPPRLLISWASMNFRCYLSECQQNFIKFSSGGYPVRAVLNCTFVQAWDVSDNAISPNESPDTAKFRNVCQGDSLWAMAAREYGSPAQWREIAEANGIVNPRRLRSGDMLAVPALD